MKILVIGFLGIFSVLAGASEYVGQDIAVQLYDIRGNKNLDRQKIFIKAYVAKGEQKQILRCERRGRLTIERVESLFLCGDEFSPLSFELLRLSQAPAVEAFLLVENSKSREIQQVSRRREVWGPHNVAEQALRPLVGRSTGSSAISEFRYLIDDGMNIMGVAILEPTNEMIPFSASLLNLINNPDSGFKKPDSLAGDIRQLLNISWRK